MSVPLSRRFSVAPMMDWTDRHCRYFLRLISKHALLYTEMVTCGAILHGSRDAQLKFDRFEHPVALQLGGSDPKQLAQCARIAVDYGYDEINLNVGCPSDRVQEGKFGACLMAEPQLVAECVAAMNNAVGIPVTVKHRIGIDDKDSWEELLRFVETVAAAGCTSFTVHARKAWLNGLSPKENREIPPLQYDTVYRLKQHFPHLEIIINGGIAEWSAIDQHLQQVDGVMIGREAYHNPWFLAQVDAHLFGDHTTQTTRAEVLREFAEYARYQLAHGSGLQHLSRHILGLYHGQKGGRLFRRVLSEQAHKRGAGIEVLFAALAAVEAAQAEPVTTADSTSETRAS